MIATREVALEKYTPEWIDMLLRNYAALVADTAELAATWAEMDAQEQIHHRSIAMQIWGMRLTLGELYRARRLAIKQVKQLTELDRALLEDASNVALVYGLSVQLLMNNLINWGTPLTAEKGTVKLEVPTQTLPILAEALAGIR